MRALSRLCCGLSASEPPSISLRPCTLGAAHEGGVAVATDGCGGAPMAGKCSESDWALPPTLCPATWDAAIGGIAEEAPPLLPPFEVEAPVPVIAPVAVVVVAAALVEEGGVRGTSLGGLSAAGPGAKEGDDDEDEVVLGDLRAPAGRTKWAIVGEVMRCEV